jgi:hypothetical protein
MHFYPQLSLPMKVCIGVVSVCMQYMVYMVYMVYMQYMVYKCVYYCDNCDTHLDDEAGEEDVREDREGGVPKRHKWSRRMALKDTNGVGE